MSVPEVPHDLGVNNSNYYIHPGHSSHRPYVERVRVTRQHRHERLRHLAPTNQHHLENDAAYHCATHRNPSFKELAALYLDSGQGLDHLEELRARGKTIRAKAERKKMQEDFVKLKSRDEEGRRADKERKERSEWIKKEWDLYHEEVKKKREAERKLREEEDKLRDEEDARRREENARREREDRERLQVDRELAFVSLRRSRSPQHRHAAHVWVHDESQSGRGYHSEGDGNATNEEQMGRRVGLHPMQGVHGPHDHREHEGYASHHRARRVLNLSGYWIADDNSLRSHHRRRQSRDRSRDRSSDSNSGSDQPSGEQIEEHEGQHQEGGARHTHESHLRINEEGDDRGRIRGGGNSDDEYEESTDETQKRFEEMEHRLEQDRKRQGEDHRREEEDRRRLREIVDRCCRQGELRTWMEEQTQRIKEEETKLHRINEEKCCKEMMFVNKTLAEQLLKSKASISEGTYTKKVKGCDNQEIVSNLCDMERKRRPDLAKQPIQLVICCFQNGRLTRTHHSLEYTLKSHYKEGDEFLVNKMTEFYETHVASHYRFRTRRVAFAKFIRWEYVEMKDGDHEQKENEEEIKEEWRITEEEKVTSINTNPYKWLITSQEPFVPYQDPSSVSAFEERFDHPLKPGQNLQLHPWLHKLDCLIETVEENPVKIWIEVFEAPNTRLIWILLFIAVLISTVSAVSYALVRSDWSGGFTIGSYMVGCGALMLALLSVGEFMGLKRPDAFSYAYDTVTNSEVFNQYTKNLKKGPRE